MVEFCFLQINMYANEEKDLFFGSGHKRAIVLLVCSCIFCLCFSFQGVILIVKTLKVLTLKNAAAFGKEKNSIWAKF